MLGRCRPSAHRPGRIAVDGADAAEVDARGHVLEHQVRHQGAGSGAGGSSNAVPTHAPLCVSDTVPVTRPTFLFILILNKVSHRFSHYVTPHAVLPLHARTWH